MNQNKIIFFDVDGTLLNPRTHDFDESTFETLKKLKQKGFKCAIATGRALESTRSLGLFDVIDWDYIIVNNGQKIINSKEETLYEQVIDSETIKRFIELADKEDIAVLGQSNEWHMWSEPNDIVREIHSKLGGVPTREDYDESIPIYTLMVYGANGEFIKEFDHLVPVYVQNYFDVLLKGNNKATAIHKVLELEGLDEYVAMGDSLNDFEMAQEATIFIATHDAVEGLKGIADFIIKEPHNEVKQAIDYLGWLNDEI